MNAREFQIIEIFVPKYFISAGKVTTPTAINVHIKTANCINPPPLLYNAAVNGNATNPGIKVAEPIIAAIIIPIQPDC